jgi:hypothetical protein
MTRTEFGAARTSCDCKYCKVHCRHMPGYMIPSDLVRMIPVGADPVKWAEENLLASPGPLVMSRETRETYRVPTLVPATKKDGSCKFLNAQGRCSIHAVSPFGCAFFDCNSNPLEASILSSEGVYAIQEDTKKRGSLYRRLVKHLKCIGKTQVRCEELRRKVDAEFAMLMRSEQTS